MNNRNQQPARFHAQRHEPFDRRLRDTTRDPDYQRVVRDINRRQERQAKRQWLTDNR